VEWSLSRGRPLYPRALSLSSSGPSGRGSRATSDALTPLDKTRSALEAKAAKGDVYAARELREHADHYYGSAATGDAWKELLTAEELETVLAVFDAARSRAQGTAPA
jgi:hypothetical protein